MTGREFELLLFSTDPGFIVPAVEAGVSGIIVDWEHIGKEGRQTSADTQINYDTADDLARVRRSTAASVICRINGFGGHTPDEVEQAVAAGVDELLLPMVRSASEVEGVLRMAGGRCRVGILVETLAAIGACQELGNLPLSRVYVGLNDLAIERGERNIFRAVVDGTVERIRGCFNVPFGFGGLTMPDRGRPIPCRLLMGEMARLGCSFSFLRRSFWNDVGRDELGKGVSAIREAIAKSAGRGADAVEKDRAELAGCINAWDGSRMGPA